MLITHYSKSQELIAKVFPNENCNLKNINLYKYDNIFSHTFLENIVLNNGIFYTKKFLSERDLYLLENPNDKKFLLFVWDGNIIIDLNCNDFSSSRVKNSETTDELRKFDSSRVALYAKPVNRLDSLLSVCYNQKPNSSLCEELKKERQNLFSISLTKTNQYILAYIKDNPNSFVSLYYLTRTGTEPTEQEYVEAFNNLSPDLKKHSRAKIYQ